jgi:hypothetical protein
MSRRPTHHVPRKAASQLRRLLRWTLVRRRSAAGHMLRGACYGAGTGAISILTVWAQRHL